jgi:hypothetical protein
MNRLRWQIGMIVLIGFALPGCEKTVTRRYQAWIALDRKGPPGFTQLSSNAPGAVLLYRYGQNGTLCYDVLPESLHDRLSSKDGKAVTAEYDTFSSYFGSKVHGYNVRSVDGIILANGNRRLRDDYIGGGGVARLGPGTASGDDCW